MVIMSNRVLAHRVATSPAINSEMTCKDRPAQSRRAALKVEYPRPLMMEPEKLVKTPLGTEEPNMAMDKSQLTVSNRSIECGSLFRIFESFHTVFPVKVGSLHTDT